MEGDTDPALPGVISVVNEYLVTIGSLLSLEHVVKIKRDKIIM